MAGQSTGQIRLMIRLMGGVAAMAVTLSFSMPGAAQQGSGADVCMALAGADQVACLRKLLAETQDALTRAERALGTSPAPPSTPARPQAPVPAQAAGAEHLGAEQAARRTGGASATPEEQRFAALIVSSERTHPNRLLVRLENGQVWRQLQSDMQVIDLPDNQRIDAEIWRSGFGGYRMRVPSIGRVLRVERMR